MHLIITNTTEIDEKENVLVLSPVYGHNIFDISEYAADSEFEEISVKCLNQIPLQILGNTLTNYVRKLRKNGKINIYGKDIYLTALQIVNRNYDLGMANLELFGGPEVNKMNISLVGINDIVNHLEELGLKIVKKNFDLCNFKIEAVKI